MSRRARDLLAAFNERVKLFAGFLNALSVGMIGFAFLRPLIEDPANADSSTLWWTLAGLVTHGFAHYILGYLEKEPP